jgi:hypothetical protein
VFGGLGSGICVTSVFVVGVVSFAFKMPTLQVTRIATANNLLSQLANDPNKLEVAARTTIINLFLNEATTSLECCTTADAIFEKCQNDEYLKGLLLMKLENCMTLGAIRQLRNITLDLSPTAVDVRVALAHQTEVFSVWTEATNALSTSASGWISNVTALEKQRRAEEAKATKEEERVAKAAEARAEKLRKLEEGRADKEAGHGQQSKRRRVTHVSEITELDAPVLQAHRALQQFNAPVFESIEAAQPTMARLGCFILRLPQADKRNIFRSLGVMALLTAIANVSIRCAFAFHVSVSFLIFSMLLHS